MASVSWPKSHVSVLHCQCQALVTWSQCHDLSVTTTVVYVMRVVVTVVVAVVEAVMVAVYVTVL
jgi:hypothetical protein